MKAYIVCIGVWTTVVSVALSVERIQAAPTATQRRELTKILKQVGQTAALIRKKKFDEAGKSVDRAEQQLEKLIKAAGFKEIDRGVVMVRRQIALRRKTLAAKRNPGTGGTKEISFGKEVAPILTKRCASCHSNNPKAGLNLSTFAGMKKGGKNGLLLVPGKPNQSLLIRRLLAPSGQRMPKGKARLPGGEIQTISSWIAQGAKFDGKDETAPIADAAKKPKPPKPKPVLAMATGGEKVSFKRDIAPFMVNLCLRCHSGKTPRSDFSIETFYELMQGGTSGVVVIGGDLDGSRMWDLAGKQDPIKMPSGQARITRTNWRNLRTWIEEGAKYDGGDPKLPLRKLVPTDSEVRAAELAKLSPEQFAQMRLQRAEQAWGRVLPKEKPESVHGTEFIVVGNVGPPRLKAILNWAHEDAKSLRSLYGDKSSLLWKGKLAIIVMKDRFGYDEFNLVIQRREVPPYVTGHSLVTKNFEDAYLVLHDVGDEVGGEQPGMRVSLTKHLTAAFLKRSGGKLPDWLLEGSGLSMAAKAAGNSDYFTAMRDRAVQSVATLAQPQDLFADGTFSPTGIGPVGYTLVAYLRTAAGDAKFSRLVKSLQGGAKIDAAIKDVYQTDVATVARSYFDSFKGKRKR